MEISCSGLTVKSPDTPFGKIALRDVDTLSFTHTYKFCGHEIMKMTPEHLTGLFVTWATKRAEQLYNSIH